MTNTDTRCLTCGQRIREVVDERDNRRWIHDSAWHTPIPAPSTDNEPYGDAWRKDRAIETPAPSTTDAVEAAWHAFEATAVTQHGIGSSILHTGFNAGWEAAEAAIGDRERERYEDRLHYLDSEVKECEAHIEALKAAMVYAVGHMSIEGEIHLRDTLAALDKEAK